MTARRVRLQHAKLGGREITAVPSPARLAAGWQPVDDTAAQAAHRPADQHVKRRRRSSNERTD